MDPEVRADVARLVDCGFYDRADLFRIVGEEIHEPGTLDPAELAEAIDVECERKRREEASWPAETEVDRLEAVFQRLATAGIVTLHNAGYTMSDGLEDVGEVYERRKAGGLATRGYCFYHGQDVERAVEGGGLYLAFGDMRDEPEAATAIGREIAAELRAAGFEVDWGEDSKKRILLPALVWRKRSPEDPPTPVEDSPESLLASIRRWLHGSR